MTFVNRLPMSSVKEYDPELYVGGNMRHPARLGVNIDHIATVRQARRSSYPDPATAAVMAELYGAAQITCHIRSDRRHIQDQDLSRLRDAVQTQLNVEMAATEEMIQLVGDILQVDPGRHRVTLVPENPTEITTEGGLNVIAHTGLIAKTVKELVAKGIAVSLFIDPVLEQVDASAIEGVDMIEINTAKYAEGDMEDIGRIRKAAQHAEQLGLTVAAGHGLTHHNLGLLVREVPEIIEYNIGHSIVARSIFVGWEVAIRDILSIIKSNDP